MNDIIKIKKRLQKQRIILISLMISLISLLAILYIVLVPYIVLNGKEKINIEVNNKYIELNAKSYVGLKELKELEIDSNVDTSKIGEYEVKYIAKYKNIKFTKVRKVIVEDTISPIITLNGSIETNVCSLDKYQDEGASAIDNFDGDLTDKIKVVKNKNSIIYRVTDSSGNEAILERKLIVNDIEVPTISINGNENLSIQKGSTYVDEGASALDNCDGDLTSKIATTGTVDTNNLGEYSIKYEVIDSSKNIATKERKIVVVDKPNYSDRVIYLTFDDGPSYSITPGILDILKEENVKATFFVINHSDSLNYLIKREFDEGHTVALHSYTHNYGTIYSSVDAYFNDLDAIDNKVNSIIGHKPNIIRFPGGSSNTISRFNPGIMTTLSKEVANRGYVYFDWNISSGDAGEAYTSSDVYNNVINNLNSKNNVVLLHDFESNYKTLNALRDMIRYAKSIGYNFDKITEFTPKIRHRVNN